MTYYLKAFEMSVMSFPLACNYTKNLKAIVSTMVTSIYRFNVI